MIDDDAVACEFLQEALSRAGYEVDSFTSAREALKEDLSRYDLLLSDIRMPEIDGLEFLRKVHERRPELPVILMTAFGSLETTMEALRFGASDYISKPFSPDAIRSLVRKVLEVRELQQHWIQGQPEDQQEPQFIGSSAVMVDFYKQIARVADASASVLISGESGTGKELTARSLHQLSNRHGKPFVAVNCGAIPETLLESELFGFEKGAFTGADHMHVGLLDAAQHGTIFLDEITEMSPALQGKLLRFMQSGEVRRLGGHEARHVGVRVVAAANRDIDAEAGAGRFRSDLLYRFVVRLQVPPLRAHKEDIPQLIESFLQKWGYPTVRISDEAMELFMGYDWPGNVRELENLLVSAAVAAKGQILVKEDFQEFLGGVQKQYIEEKKSAPVSEPGTWLSLDEVEEKYIRKVIKERGHRTKGEICEILGISRPTFERKLEKYKISFERE